MIFKIKGDKLYQFAEIKYRELVGTSKGGSRVSLRHWNEGKTGAVGSRTDCEHKHKHTALLAATTDTLGFAAFLKKQKENDKRTKKIILQNN